MPISELSYLIQEPCKTVNILGNWTTQSLLIDGRGFQTDSKTLLLENDYFSHVNHTCTIYKVELTNEFYIQHIKSSWFHIVLQI